MRRPLLAVALVILVLLALCGIVFGFLAWQGQANLSKQIDELKMELGKGTPAPTPAPAPSGTNPGRTPTPTPTNPPTASCVGENELINVNSPDTRCCDGLVEVDLDVTQVIGNLNARCVGV